SRVFRTIRSSVPCRIPDFRAAAVCLPVAIPKEHVTPPVGCQQEDAGPPSAPGTTATATNLGWRVGSAGRMVRTGPPPEFQHRTGQPLAGGVRASHRLALS